jgi:hypothetical protein
MTKKEIKAMSGECQTYRLNEPMKWDEWKAMPDDIRCDYINLIRTRFKAPDTAIAEMMGVHKVTMAKEIAQLGIGKGGHSGGGRKWDKEGFLMWVNGVPVEQAELPVIEGPVEEVAEEFQGASEVVKTLHIPPVAPVCCLPKNGEMRFEGNAEEILNTLRTLLGGARVNLNVWWQLDEGKVMEAHYGET